jgi:hypothetical protein
MSAPSGSCPETVRDVPNEQLFNEIQNGWIDDAPTAVIAPGQSQKPRTDVLRHTIRVSENLRLNWWLVELPQAR